MIMNADDDLNMEAVDVAEVQRAAELCGVSTREIIRRGAAIYALQLLAKYDALPLTRPEPWRQFRVEDGGHFVSFRVRLPLSTFSQAVYIAQQVRKENGGGAGEDACEIAEGHLISRLSNLPAKNKKEREARNKAFMQWIDTQKDLAERLHEIESEVENG